jgi:hypothetical protein
MTPGTLLLLQSAGAAYDRAKAEILDGTPPARVAQDLALAGELLIRSAEALVREATTTHERVEVSRAA